MTQYNYSQMEPSGEGGIIYLGAQTEWLPAEQFMNIKNWTDSLKPSALHYIKKIDGWVASEMGGCARGKGLTKGGIFQDASHTISNPTNFAEVKH